MEDPIVLHYHPDPEINAAIHADALEAEKADLAAGFPPRRWRCDCGAEHGRGHFGVIGSHRCMACGKAGAGGFYVPPPGEHDVHPDDLV